ncbi:ADP-dependent NAD(P)H-hydrate dehydratase [Schumannella soli]|uniref:ADP-dependent (S)-NAD(P)H-hydrate dehydratase n=1 Tax=Schumannella soli TaxID=2590779 RepID=A0A506Y6B9_9MICO|nr:ADP/ATP-dependent (S)-NAD(P)H-hydrate dehydratase [Schumannella soli]TPW75939.1 NAD(P)H-hydrate dehydratase [Schumannella soli]
MDVLHQPADAARWIAVPGAADDKYSRGVLGIVTGSTRYPGAAVLGVEAAMRTGVGMIRYLGPGRATRLVLQRRPEAVTAPGRVQAWLIGSGQDASDVDPQREDRIAPALASPVPTVLDGGGFELRSRISAPAVLTPHAGELARLVGSTRAEVEADPREAAVAAARGLNAVVLLKGHSTYAADPHGRVLVARSAPTWTATAGAGDALAGILGALVATHADEIAADPGVLVDLAATAAVLHGLAAARASHGGPLTILDLAAELPGAIAALVATR